MFKHRLVSDVQVFTHNLFVLLPKSVSLETRKLLNNVGQIGLDGLLNNMQTRATLLITLFKVPESREIMKTITPSSLQFVNSVASYMWRGVYSNQRHNGQ